MSVTIKKIAEVSGVSRGTVDRVLNNRGNVQPDTEKRVRKVAQQLGYSPNLAGKALAVRKKSPLFGVLLPSEGNAFFDDVIIGIRNAENELRDFGVRIEIKTMRGFDPVQQLKCIEEFEDRISMLLLVPINDIRIAEKIDSLKQKGIPTIALNTDIENSSRLCYVGSDYKKSGGIACGMMALLTGGKANFGVAMGSYKMLGHSQRIAGFHSVMKARYPDLKMLEIIETNDDDICAYEETSKMLQNHPEMDAIFIVAGGVYGVCRAVLRHGCQEKMTIVSFDDIPTTVEMVERGIIKATICQQPVAQGYQAVKKAFDYYISGSEPETERFILGNEIKIRESLVEITEGHLTEISYNI
jgi:LacI family transcriptional regulator